MGGGRLMSPLIVIASLTAARTTMAAARPATSASAGPIRARRIAADRDAVFRTALDRAVASAIGGRARSPHYFIDGIGYFDYT